jgi:hypothetical protein
MARAVALIQLPLDVSDFVTFPVTSARSNFQIKQLQRKGHNPPAEPGYATIQPDTLLTPWSGPALRRDRLLTLWCIYLSSSAFLTASWEIPSSLAICLKLLPPSACLRAWARRLTALVRYSWRVISTSPASRR